MKIGDKEVDVVQFRNDWALALMNRGVIVKLEISRWSGMTTLSPQDLGLKYTSEESDDFMHKYIQLGRQKLFPPEIHRELNAISQEARNNLDNFSFDTVWGKFVPFTAFNEWHEQDKRIREEFMGSAKMISERYDEILQTVKTEYRILARDVWGRLYPGTTPTESFLENFVSNVISMIPSREDIVSSFDYGSTYFSIPLPSFIERDLSKAEEVRMQREQDVLQNELEKETRRVIAAEYVERKRELIDGFLESTVGNMRKYVSELCSSVLDSVGKQSTETQKGLRTHQIKKLKTMIHKVNFLNFQNDKEIDKILRGLENEIDKFKGERDDDVIVNTLKALVQKGTEEFLPEEFSPAVGYLEV